MTNTLRIKRRSSGSPGAPSSLAAAELAFNEVDNTLWYGKGNSGGQATSILNIGGPGAYMPQIATIAALRSNTTALTNSVYVRGYYVDGDGGEGIFLYNASDTTSADNGGTIIVDGSSRRWYRQGTNVTLWSVKWFGAKGNTVINATTGAVTSGTDDTTAIQNAITACTAAQRTLLIPGGHYRISASFTLTRGVRITGDYVEPQTSLFQSNPNEGGNGSWLVLDGTQLISVFIINASGTPSSSNQAFGIEIEHLAFYHVQPVPTAGWAPSNYPPAIDIPAGSDIHLHDLCIFNPTVAIRASGQAEGRILIERIIGQPLTQGMVFDNLTDTVTVRDIHFWVHWSLDNNVLTWQKTNGVALQLGRIDNPIFDSFFCIWYWVGVQIVATSNGQTNQARFSNCDFDICGNPFVINDSVGGHVVYFSNCLLGGPGDTTSVSGVNILGSGSGSLVFISTCSIAGFGNSCINNVATGGANIVAISSSQLYQWDIRNVGNSCLLSGTNNIVRCDSTSKTFSLNSNTNVLGGGGQCIRDTPVWMTHGTMGSGATSVTLPHLLGVVPDMILISHGNPYNSTKWWASATATNVTVSCDNPPGSGSVTFWVQLGLDPSH